MVPVQYNLRSLLVRKVTTIATAGGIALVVFVFAGALMLGEGVNQALGVAGRSDVAVILRKGSDAELASAIGNNYVKLFGVPAQVAQASGVIGEIVVVITAEHEGDTKISNVLVRGMPAEGFKFRPEMKLTNGRMPNPGTNEVIVGKGISGRFKGVGLGKSFDLRRNRPLQVVGEFATDGSSYESEVWGDLDVIRRSLGREGVVSSVRVRLNSPSDFDAYRQTIESDKQFSMKVMSEPEYLTKQGQQTSNFLKFTGLAIAILFSLAAMIGAAITMNAAVANRSREIGTLRALGFSRKAILSSFLLEAIFLALIGGVVGTAFVMLLSFVTFPVMNFATFSEIVIRFHATPNIVGNALIFSAVMGVAGGLVPAIRAARVSPIEAMRA